MKFTLDDIVNIFNSVGFDSLEEAIQSITLSKSFVEVGFTDPTVLKPVLERLKLLDTKLKLQGQLQALQAEQQQKISELVQTTNSPMGELNNEIASIDSQLARLQIG